MDSLWRASLSVVACNRSCICGLQRICASHRIQSHTCKEIPVSQPFFCNPSIHFCLPKKNGQVFMISNLVKYLPIQASLKQFILLLHPAFRHLTWTLLGINQDYLCFHLFASGVILEPRCQIGPISLVVMFGFMTRSFQVICSLEIQILCGTLSRESQCQSWHRSLCNWCTILINLSCSLIPFQGTSCLNK